jgi:hypothetical protein
MIFHQRQDRISTSVVAALMGTALLLSLVLPAQLLLSSPDTDLVGQFVASRAFFSHTLMTGHLPLWNPYTYGGMPFLGAFESAVLYPPNLLFLLLPLAPALNFSFLLHLIILGWGMERWVVRRGLNPWAAGLAGIILPLSGAVFPHLYAGHLSNLCTMAWAPWIFLGLEEWVSRGNRHGLFLANAGICLQIFAGHVQYVFYTGIAAGVQAVVLAVAEPKVRWRSLPAVAGCYVAGAILSAAQFLPGMATASEGVRSQKLDYDFAAMFSFPPENFLTLLAPGFFGSLPQPVYWGRCYLWEMSLFIGTASLPLIALACCDARRWRQAYLDLTAAALLLILASGCHTPLFTVLYDYAPGFGHFRSTSKFIFPATLFLLLTVAAGADFVLREGRKTPRVAWSTLAAGGSLGLAGIFLLAWPDAIGGMLGMVASSRESYLPEGAFTNAAIISQAGTNAGLSLGLGALVLIAASAALFFREKSSLVRWAIPLLVLLEMLGFAAGQIATSSVKDAVPDVAHEFVANHPGDYRVLDFREPNNGFLLGAGDLWGNSPAVLRRYAEFMTFTQGVDPDHAEQYLEFRRIDPLYALLRFRYAFVTSDTGEMRVVESPTPPLPRLQIISDWKMPGRRDALFAALRDPSFHADETVLLENAPNPIPQPDAVGSARLLSESPNALEIEAQADKPALLLITDLYARDWKAEALPGSVQKNYSLMPADYILRAIPLAAGQHHLRVVYAPAGLSMGIIISLTSWALWFGLFVGLRKKAPRTSPATAPTSSSPPAAKKRKR